MVNDFFFICLFCLFFCLFFHFFSMSSLFFVKLWYGCLGSEIKKYVYKKSILFWGDILYRQISVFYSNKQSYIWKSPHLALCPSGRLAKLWNPEHGKRPVWVGCLSGNLMATGWRCHSNGIVSRRWPCRVQTRLLLFWVWWKTSEVIFYDKMITKLLCTLGPTFKHIMNCFFFFLFESSYMYC